MMGLLQLIAHRATRENDAPKNTIIVNGYPHPVSRGFVELHPELAPVSVRYWEIFDDTAARMKFARLSAAEKRMWDAAAAALQKDDINAAADLIVQYEKSRA